MSSWRIICHMLKITKNPRSTGSNEGSQICGLGISTGLDNRGEVRKVEATSDWEGKWKGKPRKRKCRDVGHGQQFKRFGGKDRVEKKRIHSRNGPRHPWFLSSLGLAVCLFDSQLEFFSPDAFLPLIWQVCWNWTYMNHRGQNILSLSLLST